MNIRPLLEIALMALIPVLALGCGESFPADCQKRITPSGMEVCTGSPPVLESASQALSTPPVGHSFVQPRTMCMTPGQPPRQPSTIFDVSWGNCANPSVKGLSCAVNTPAECAAIADALRDQGAAYFTYYQGARHCTVFPQEACLPENRFSWPSGPNYALYRLEKKTVNVMTWNMACRDMYPYAGCDNCTTRFAQIAHAIDGEPGYLDVPDFDDVDVILGQELFTQPETYQQVTEALRRKGFHHVTTPAPDANSPQCGTPLQLGSAVAGVRQGDSGGLVMWSRHPVRAFKERLWCVNGFPTHQGYTSALLEVEGRSVVVFNMHMMPEVDLGPMRAEDVRMYQFSEIANLAKDIDAQLGAANGAYSIIVGGDYNEDAYHLSHRTAEPACDRMRDVDVNTKFHALNFDLENSCRTGVVGAPTWDPTHNDLARRFSSTGKHEVLDYLIHYASSGIGEDTPNRVHNIQSQQGWSGSFCDNALQGVLSGTSRATAHSLSDHNAVVARFALPPLAGRSVDAPAVFNSAFDRFAVQRAACGQADTACVTDSNCCRSPEYAFDGNGYQCNQGVCERAKLEGERCQWLAQGSECLGYDTYPGGLHCESGTCVRKFPRGRGCYYDHECDSHACSWSWRGRKCE